MTYDEQLDRCDHVPYIHNVLADRFECFCGKTSLVIIGRCPVKPPCLCARRPAALSRRVRRLYE